VFAVSDIVCPTLLAAQHPLVFSLVVVIKDASAAIVELIRGWLCVVELQRIWVRQRSSITRHDILNQITGLAGYIGLLGEVLPDDPEMRKYIDRITKATSAIERQITFTHDYEHLGVDPSRWERVTDALSNCIHITGVNVSIDIGTLEVFADPMLEKVFLNLFDNAVRHGEHVTEISVTCRKEDGARTVIAVDDNGIGISAEMKKRIFRDGFGRNTGYGLFLVQELLAITGMSIQETGEEGKGACFEIIVPNDVWRGD